MSTIPEMSIPSVYAKEIGVTAQTVTKWIDKDELKPVHTIGHVKLYLREELDALRTKYGKDKSDYVHPDKYKAMEDLHRNAAFQAAQAVSELRALQEKFNLLQEEYNALADKLDEHDDQDERDRNEQMGSGPVTDQDLDDAMAQQYPNTF